MQEGINLLILRKNVYLLMLSVSVNKNKMY